MGETFSFGISPWNEKGRIQNTMYAGAIRSRVRRAPSPLSHSEKADAWVFHREA